ncbi:ABC transporter permease [Lentilactobacillus hilgardii]|uniref:Bacterial ABC transporter protein EcsB n=1 Tax=Lentilactobacillus hilgardii (strain ATCC 8290 / DSM 20176 / CCUG 30140 / JCM 1155 / KCTC 3500 / NBRC 15886 / NCIMB 8040 / NRRL B-1843 / 9) TaxID=1423757 RepID=C0XME5_LENH9|nr:ABC transporter permease [Lentilactobacillus hilgardii]EEI23493.1 bacterial ABC transporter protein EcsB [Lentilactobacillus hilgardii DSM 20176 = ATCC 8290]KRK58381.1 ABC superfamily ATP binding cassette transporter, membrane protein [Lentilactobacillus hilgardii DSM 20176 = ATCC 8290]MCP9333538.1 ABC transporter permease [Lentilactobacillus hilgardii]MCP9350115.1 ABC transporter permease [Lentilactobacillus hilgardii]MCP9352992.1 ABC transporter permease [Lentilactobacillus hilgardii]
MKTLFKKRLGAHLTELTKYLRLVFNDYFVLALVFMIGGLGYYYSNALKQLTTGLWWAPLLIIIVLLISVQTGRMATLIEDPDYVFLLPKEAELIGYLKRAFWYSTILAALMQLLFWIVLMPFIQVTVSASAPQLFSLLGTIIFLKVAWMNADFARKYHLQHKWMGNRWLFRLIIPVVVLAISIYVNYFIGVILAAIVMIGGLFTQNAWKKRSVDWQTLIADENSRMHSIYQFFNLFTDVPSLRGSVKRRRYLDWLLHKIKLLPDNTYLYLYAHGIIRDNEMSGLYVRLTVIGTLLLVFIKGEVLPIVLCLLFLYLIGFQMIPFYFHFDDNAFVHIYPVTTEFQLKNFQRVLLMMMGTVAVIFAIAVIAVNLTTPVTVIGVLIGEAIEVGLFIFMYVPRRIKKSEFSR